MKIFGYNLSKEVKSLETPKIKQEITPNESIDFGKIEVPILKEKDVRGIYIDYEDPFYPKKILSYLNESALHNRIVISKANMVAGGDILVDGVNYTEWVKTAPSDQALILTTFIENGYYDDLDIIKSQIALDLEISGNYYLEVIWARDFSRIAGYKYHPWTNLRPGPEDQWGQIPYFIYSNDFSKHNSEKIKIQAFDPFSLSRDGVTEGELENYPYEHNQIIMVKNHWPYLKYFGRPQYYGGILDIEASTFISKYNINSIQSGFSPSVIINYPEPQSQEERNKIARNIEKVFTGLGRKVALFWKNGEQKADIQPIDVKNISDQYLALQDKTTQSILTAHSITAPEMVGIQTPGKLGNAELDIAWSIYYNNIILPNKRQVEKVFNTLLKINGFKSKIEFEVKKPWDSLGNQNNAQ